MSAKKSTKKPTAESRGGKREGAGRKPALGKSKVRCLVYFHPAVLKHLQATATATGKPLGDLIAEKAIPPAVLKTMLT